MGVPLLIGQKVSFVIPTPLLIGQKPSFVRGASHKDSKKVSVARLLMGVPLLLGQIPPFVAGSLHLHAFSVKM